VAGDAVTRLGEIFALHDKGMVIGRRRDGHEAKAGEKHADDEQP
jgi:hypothetical protein